MRPKPAGGAPDAAPAGEVGLLRVEELSTHFKTRDGVIRAVDGVSFFLDEGEVLGVVGESGCGKSVMAQSVLRILPEPLGRITGGSHPLPSSGRRHGRSGGLPRRRRGACAPCVAARSRWCSRSR